MPTVRVTRDIRLARDLLAFRGALAQGWDRERIMSELGISRRTHDRWLAAIEKASPARPSQTQAPR